MIELLSLILYLSAGEFYLLFCATVLPIILLMMGVVWGVMSFLTPRVSKTITRASIFHYSLALIWQPNHLIKVIGVKLMPEGYLVTRGKKPQRIPVARPVFEYKPSPLDEEKDERKRIEGENNELRGIEREAIRVSMFDGCRVPVFAVYSGVALAVNVETMVSLDSENAYRKVWTQAFGENYEEEMDKIKATMPNGGTPMLTSNVGQRTREFKDMLVKVFLPINPEGIKRHLAKLVDQTTIDGIYADGWQEGFEEGKAGKNERMFLYMILALIGTGIGIMALIHFAG